MSSSSSHSIKGVSLNNTTTTSTTTTLPSPPTHQHHFNNMTGDQQKYCGAIMRNLKRHRDATPFLKPVDYVKLNVPDYPLIIRHPMDLNRVETKLNNSDYSSVEEFVADVRLVFNNCFKYNGPEAMISVLCQNVESAFEKSLRQMPPSVSIKQEQQQLDMVTKEPSPPLSQHNSSSPPPCTSFSIAAQTEGIRPKREIHCPSKDYPETFTTPMKRPSHNTSIGLKYCWTILKEFKKSKYRNQIYPFLQPVDPIALNLPDYTTIIKQPMDLSTIEDKLLNEEYKTPEEFYQDVMLMFNNCYLYNPKTLPIYQMAQEMEKIFKEKWDQRPIYNSAKAKKEEEEKENIKKSGGNSRRSSSTATKVDHKKKNSVEFKLDEEVEMLEDPDDQIAKLERSLKNIATQIESMQQPTNRRKKSTPPPQEEEEPPKPKKRLGRPVGRTDSVKRKRMTKKAVLDDSEDEAGPFSHEEKMALSKEINGLDSDRLIHVGQIIQASMPHLQKNGEEEVEIELDIDALDIHTLNEIYSYIHPYSRRSNKNKTQLKRFKKSRTHYSEQQADQMIHELEQKLKGFDEYEKNHLLNSSASSPTHSVTTTNTTTTTKTTTTTTRTTTSSTSTQHYHGKS